MRRGAAATHTRVSPKATPLLVMGVPGCFANTFTATPPALAPVASHCLWVVVREALD